MCATWDYPCEMGCGNLAHHVLSAFGKRLSICTECHNALSQDFDIAVGQLKCIHSMRVKQ